MKKSEKPPGKIDNAEELKASGWEKRGVYDEPRLSELAALFSEIGFEIRLEPTAFEDLSGCAECIKAHIDRYKTIYTRKV